MSIHQNSIRHLFDTDERKAFLDLALESVDGLTPVGFIVESSSTAVSMDLAKYAEKVGADYIFTTVPYRIPHTGVGIYEYFKAINDVVNLPVLVYNGHGPIWSLTDPIGPWPFI